MCTSSTKIGLFLTLYKELIPCIPADDTARVPNKIALRRRAANCSDEESSSENEIPITYHGYIMRGSRVNVNMEQVFLTAKKIVSNLQERISKRVNNLESDSIFAAVETLVDTKSYRRNSADAVY